MSIESLQSVCDNLGRETLVKMGLDRLPLEKLAGTLLLLVKCLPRQELHAHVQAQLQSPSPGKRFIARELGLLLFVQEQLHQLPTTISPEEQRAIVLETVEQMLAKPPTRPV